MKLVKKFPIPLFMFMGRHDYTAPSESTAAWLKMVNTPVKGEEAFFSYDTFGGAGEDAGEVKGMFEGGS